MVGQTISHYQILRKLGGGGMGVVYAAEDLRLHRQVALKFLSPRLASAPQALARFEREAMAASACNHPHICIIHDIDRHNGAPFIVMELIDGVSLRERLAEGPLPPVMLLTLGIQIADALESAHAAGIIHRDLTPANVFVTRRGDAKVLDFGIAKLFAEQPSEQETGSTSGAPDAPLTGRGHVLGTPGYASPEQTLGLPVDARTDLFSLGVILYQMATGRRPFDGHTPGLVSDAVVHVTPVPPLHLNAQVPAELAAVIEKALEKDPGLRHQSAADLKADLRRVKRNLERAPGDMTPAEPMPWVEAHHDSRGGVTAPPTPSQASTTVTAPLPLPWWRRPVILSAALLLVVLAAAWTLLGRWAASDGLPHTVSRSVTSGVGNDTDPAISPDGRRIAYVEELDKAQAIWMVDTQGGGRPWKTGAAAYRHPSWSPDGRLLYFDSDANGQPGVYQAESLNPDATTFVAANAGQASVSPDGTRLAFVRPGGALGEPRIAVAPLSDIRAVTMVSSDGQGRWTHADPVWSPDSREICYSAFDGLWVVPAEGGKARQLTHSDSTDLQPAWARSGFIYFSSKRGGLWQLWRVRARGGTPTPVTVGLGVERAPTVSPDGRLLVYSTASETYDLVILDLKTHEQHSLEGGDQQIMPTFSADGRTVFFNMTSGNRQGIWRQELADGAPSGSPQALLPPSPPSAPPSKASQPACAPDGSRVAFLRLQLVRAPADPKAWLWSALGFVGFTKPGAASEHWARSIWTVPAAGGMPVPFTSLRDVDEYHPAWSPDGRFLAFVRERDRVQQIWIQPIRNGEPGGAAARLTEGRGTEMAPTWSPDGTLMAFIRTDTSEVAVAPVDRHEPPRVLTTGAGALSLRWRSPDRLLVSGYWGSGRASLRSIDPATGGQLTEMAPIDLGRSLVAGVFDISRDGRYLVMARSSAGHGRIGVLEATSGRF